MPTFDNFKDNYKGPASKPKKVQEKAQATSMDISSAPLSMKSKEMMDAMASESQNWEKYQYDL